MRNWRDGDVNNSRSLLSVQVGRPLLRQPLLELSLVKCKRLSLRTATSVDKVAAGRVSLGKRLV